MWISKRTDYAARALIVLAMEQERFLKLGELSGRTRVPAPMLEQIMVVLRTGGYVRSQRGRAGGYRLNRPASEVTLERIVRTFQGPLAPIGCATRKHPEPCPLDAGCSMLDIWKDVRDRTIEILSATTLEDLAARASGPWRFPAADPDEMGAPASLQ